MLAHGANPDVMSEDDYELVMVALNDGLIGNKSLIGINGALTAGVFNYLRTQNAKAYTLQDIIGIMHDYIYRPMTEEEKKQLANERLLSFMSMKPDVPDLLKPKE